MLGKRKTILFIICILAMMQFFITAEPIHARSHVIESYSFDIPGKTLESAVRRTIVPHEGDSPFATREALIQALEKKQRTLFNMRIFNEVAFSYEELYTEEETIYYHAEFFIDDSFTFLPIPYAKYDSNYGLRAGLKAHDRNLFGTFARLDYVGHATQVEPDSFNHIDYYSELRIRDIPLGNVLLDFSGDFAFTHQDRSTIQDGVFDVGLSLSNLRILNNTLSIGADFAMEQLKSSSEEHATQWGKGDLAVSADIGRIFLFDEPFRFDSTVSILQREDSWSYPDLESQIRLTWLDLEFRDHPYAPVFSAEQSFSTIERDMYKNEFTAGVQSSFSLPLHISHRAYAGIAFDMKHIFFVPSNYRFETEHTFSKGSIDWNNNFREGAQASLHFSGDYSFGRDFADLEDRFTYDVTGELTTFWLLGDRLNISTQTKGFYAYVPVHKGDNYKFPRFLPTSGTNPATMMRGILLNTFDDQDEFKTGLTSNLNLSMLAVKIDGFAESFITPFFDFGILHNDPTTNEISTDTLDLYTTAGMEGHVIFDRYRSYPFRGSLGFNLAEVNSYLQGDISSFWGDVEWELVITMDLHF